MVPRTRAKETRMLTGRFPVIAFSHGAGENEDLCLISRAFLDCTKDVTIEMLGLAKSRPAMKRSHCVADAASTSLHGPLP